MMQLRELRLTGTSKPPASVRFNQGANVFSGVSDTGKSYMFHCIDYAFGADKMEHEIGEADGYEHVLLELVNDEGKTLSLKRALKGGKISTYNVPLDQIQGNGKVVPHKRTGKSAAEDLTAIVFPFAGLSDVDLRRNKKGKTQRLTIRTMTPIFLVDEDSIFAVSSPVAGVGGFDMTARKRMLSYLLTGVGDTKPVGNEDDLIQRAKALAKIELLTELLQPIDAKGANTEDDTPEEAIDDMIANLTGELQQHRVLQDRLKTGRAEAIKGQQFAEGQLIAIDEMLTRYGLLDQRYGSDLERLDFIAEGSHFFDALQQERCPLCDQPMDAEHYHSSTESASAPLIYAAAQAEASKIRSLQSDLGGTTDALRKLRLMRDDERVAFVQEAERLGAELDEQIVPALVNVKQRLDVLIQQRLNLQARNAAREQAAELRRLQETYTKAANQPRAPEIKWDSLDTIALHNLCLEIEAVLKEWAWLGDGRVTFDEKAFDILVDGKSRRSHGQGVRAVLHAAFAVGLLQYGNNKKKPHPGFVLLDSPLTTYKQRRDQAATGKDEPADKSIEEAFWRSLNTLSGNNQIIVFDNKEPPGDVAAQINYEFFAGPDAAPTDRRGFIPS